MNEPTNWREELEDYLHDAKRFYSDGQKGGTIKATEQEIKDEFIHFIESVEQSARTDAVAQHDAKWHPINERYQMENKHGAVQALEELSEEIVKMHDNYQGDDSSDYGSSRAMAREILSLLTAKLKAYE
jgi:hypothetical protein